MFVCPIHCINGSNCVGLKAADEKHPAPKPLFVHSGSSFMAYGICAHCAVAKASKQGAFLTVHGNGRILMELSTGFEQEVTAEIKKKIFGLQPPAEKSSGDQGSRQRRAKWHIINRNTEPSNIDTSGEEGPPATNSDDGMPPKVSLTTDLEQEIHTPMEADDQPTAGGLFGPDEETSSVYKRTYLNLISTTNEFVKNSTPKPTETLSVDALALIVATTLASGYHVFISNDLVDEKVAFAATKLASSRLSASFMIAQNKTLKTHDRYLCDAAGLSVADRWSRSKFKRLQLNVRVMRMNQNARLSPDAVKYLIDDASPTTADGQKTVKEIRYVFTGINGELAVEGDTVMLSRATLRQPELLRQIASSEVFSEALYGEQAVQIIHYCLAHNPTMRTEEVTADFGVDFSVDAGVDSLRSKINAPKTTLSSMGEAATSVIETKVLELQTSIMAAIELWKTADHSYESESTLSTSIRGLLTGFLNNHTDRDLALEAARRLQRAWPGLLSRVSREVKMLDVLRASADVVFKDISTSIDEEVLDLSVS